MADSMTTTPFQIIYNSFLDKITDDMYLAWTTEDTYNDLKNILLSAIPKFSFPRFKLYDYNKDAEILLEDGQTVIGYYNCVLSEEEINILAELMKEEWLGRQIYTMDLIKMKYSSSDFKMTSQANHLDKLLSLKKDTEATCKKLQNLYKRRKTDTEGYIRTNYSGFGKGVFD